MMRRLWSAAWLPSLACVVLIACQLSAQTGERKLLAHGGLRYPPIARAAHFSGVVVLDLQLQVNGSAGDVSVASGPLMLQGAAIDFAHTLRFTEGPSETRKISVRFELVDPGDGYTDEDQSSEVKEEVDRAGNGTVRIMGFGGKSRSHCPTPAEAIPPLSRGPDDFVELYRGACMGSCPVYSVRVAANGAVTWNPRPFDHEASVKTETAQIDPAEAASLLDEMLAPAVWGACEDYSSNTTDSASYGLTISIRGRVKHIGEYAAAAPEFVHALELRVDEVSDSHRWRVGDPKSETLMDADADSWLPKPGKTKLMQIARSRRPEEIQAVLKDGADVKAVDSSGWTALMYAASSYDSNGVKVLLAAGADPNFRGPHGETALMFAASRGDADEELLLAKADPNATLDGGATVLMMLAQRGQPEEIRRLLDHGADARAKDSKKRTAVDYLVAASCGQAILAERQEWMRIGYSTCTALNSDEFKESKLLLEQAGSQQTQVYTPAAALDVSP